MCRGRCWPGTPCALWTATGTAVSRIAGSSHPRRPPDQAYFLGGDLRRAGRVVRVQQLPMAARPATPMRGVALSACGSLPLRSARQGDSRCRDRGR
jgi:hypothetical protein